MPIVESLLLALLSGLAAVSVLFGYWRLVVVPWLKRRTRAAWKVASGATVLGIYHPFCAGHAGGERVLWQMIHVFRSLHDRGVLNLHVVVYAADTGKRPGAILRAAAERFGFPDLGTETTINTGGRSGRKAESPRAMVIDFKFIAPAAINRLDESAWPRFTMIGQSLASVVVAWLGLWAATPDVFLDTTGAAFTLPLANVLMGCRCGVYVHYPTISTDMLAVVFSRRPGYNHSGSIARSKIATCAKLVYYCLFAMAYSLAGACAHHVMVNSTWTKNHIDKLWLFSRKAKVVYPPCNVSDLSTASLGALRRKLIVSIAQFRPEKDHELQLRAFKRARESNDGVLAKLGVQLVLIGSCRGEADEGRVSELRALARNLGVSDHVTFVINCHFEELRKWLKEADVGLHTMWNEVRLFSYSPICFSSFHSNPISLLLTSLSIDPIASRARVTRSLWRGTPPLLPRFSHSSP